MPISSHRKHKIYIAATMSYGLGSDDPEEVAYYKKVQDKIEKDRENGNLGVARED